MAKGRDTGIMVTISAAFYIRISASTNINHHSLRDSSAFSGIRNSIIHANRKVIASYFVDDMIVYLGKSRDFSKKLPQLVMTFDNMAGLKMNGEKPIVFFIVIHTINVYWTLNE